MEIEVDTDDDDASSICSASTVDSIYFDDNDPLFEEAWTQVWNEKERYSICNILGARLTSLKRNQTRREFDLEFDKVKHGHQLELNAMRNTRLRLFEKEASKREKVEIRLGAGILIVPDLKNIKIEMRQCRWGANCTNKNCIFEHVDRKQPTPRPPPKPQPSMMSMRRRI